MSESDLDHEWSLRPVTRGEHEKMLRFFKQNRRADQQRIAELEQEKDQIERSLSHMKCNWMQYESAKVKEARADERERLLPIISRLLEAYNDGYELSGDEIDDAYRALEDE